VQHRVRAGDSGGSDSCRHPYNVKVLAELLNAKPREIKEFLRGQLAPGRTQELQNELRQEFHFSRLVILTECAGVDVFRLFLNNVGPFSFNLVKFQQRYQMRNRNLSKVLPPLEFCLFCNSQKCVSLVRQFWGLDSDRILQLFV
jgi:hypothetical protein